jgi:hypothetical protein
MDMDPMDAGWDVRNRQSEADCLMAGRDCCQPGSAAVCQCDWSHGNLGIPGRGGCHAPGNANEKRRNCDYADHLARSLSKSSTPNIEKGAGFLQPPNLLP